MLCQKNLQRPGLPTEIVKTERGTIDWEWKCERGHKLSTSTFPVLLLIYFIVYDLVIVIF